MKTNYSTFKKIAFLFCLTIVLASCDPVADMDAFVTNNSNEVISITFKASPNGYSEDRTFRITVGEEVRVQEAFDVGSTYLEPNFEAYDSIYIQNSADEILKVFKETTTGKNMYNVSSWTSQEPSKRSFDYYFTIEESDLE